MESVGDDYTPAPEIATDIFNNYKEGAGAGGGIWEGNERGPFV